MEDKHAQWSDQEIIPISRERDRRPNQKKSGIVASAI